MTNIMERLQLHYNKAINHFGVDAVLGVFHYGSFNYNTNTPDSDVDTKCILIPDLYHLAIKPYEVKHLHIGDEVCECMTIMHIVNNWKKQNINFVETMFTDYCIINPLYKDFWEKHFPLADREKVARYDLRQAIHSMVHQAIHTIKQDPEDPKKVMNGLRIARTLEKVLDTKEPYRDCIWMAEDVREHRYKAPESSFVKLLLLVLESYLEELDYYADKGSFKPAVDRMLEELIMNLIQFREEGFI